MMLTKFNCSKCNHLFFALKSMHGMHVCCPFCKNIVELEYVSNSPIEYDKNDCPITFSQFRSFFSETAGSSEIGNLIANSLGFQLVNTDHGIHVTQGLDSPVLVELLYLFFTQDKQLAESVYQKAMALWR
jgi:heme/copper-type cytochrome/quinol oxidase subunit 3